MSLIHEALKRAAREGQSDLIPPHPRKVHVSAQSPSATRTALTLALVLATGAAGAFMLARPHALPAGGAGTTVKAPVVHSNPAPPPAAVLSPEQPVTAAVSRPAASNGAAESREHIRNARRLFNGGMYREAEAEYREVVRTNPSSAVYRNNLGRVLAELGRTGEAETEYRAALEIDPKYTPAMNNLGLLYDRQNRFDEAIRLYEEALRLQPDYAEAHLNYASVLDRWGYPGKARSHYEAFLRNASGESRRMIPIVREHLADQG